MTRATSCSSSATSRTVPHAHITVTRLPVASALTAIRAPKLRPIRASACFESDGIIGRRCSWLRTRSFWPSAPPAPRVFLFEATGGADHGLLGVQTRSMDSPVTLVEPLILTASSRLARRSRQMLGSLRAKIFDVSGTVKRRCFTSALIPIALSRLRASEIAEKPEEGRPKGDADALIGCVERPFPRSQCILGRRPRRCLIRHQAEPTRREESGTNVTRL